MELEDYSKIADVAEEILSEERISYDCAFAIALLRNDSSWTQEREDELLELGLMGY